MEQYYIKIGDMYIYNICTDGESVKTNFIYKLELNNTNEYAKRINKDEQNKYNKILKEIFNLENDYNIQFEKIIESEEENNGKN